MLGNRLLITVLLGSVAATSAWSQRASQGTAWNQRPSSKIEAERSRAGKEQAFANYGRLPLSFEANQGQTDDRVKFLSHGPGFSLFLTSAEAVLALSKPLEEGSLETLPEARPVTPRKILTSALRIKLVGANPAPNMEGLEELAGKSNYFVSNDPTKWQANVATFAKVKYSSVYPGVDLAYYGNHGALEHDFIVSPSGDPRAITLGFDGRERLRVDEHGDLVIKGRIGVVRLEKPVVYQEVGGIRQQVAGGYVRKGRNQVGFWVGKYDATKALVIDPVLSYSTYINSNWSANEWATGIAVDSAGSAYLTGQTDSPSFPTTMGAFQTTYGGSLAPFVMKLNAAGSELIYSTYLGVYGSGNGIAVDSIGSAYVTGMTTSANFPTTAGAFQTVSPGGAGVPTPFVTKLNSTGSALIYSTFLGGTGGDYGFAIAVDSTGSAYVAGHTGSFNFPVTPGAFRTANSWPSGFVTKLSVDGSSLMYSTYLGSNNYYDNCNAIAVDSAGSAYVTGITYGYLTTGFGFPVTPGAFQTAKPTSSPTAFVTKLNATGSALIYSTFLGGSDTGSQSGQGIAVDSAGSAYVTGTTYSTSFPTTPGAFQTTFSGTGSDAFVTKLNPAGSALIYSTYLGGSTYIGGNQWDPPHAIAIDPAGSAYVTGTTNSSTFPTTADAFQPAFNGATNAFVTKLNSAGSALIYSTYLGGGTSYDSGFAIAVDSTGSAYVTGRADSSNFPVTPGAFRTTKNINASGFVAKFGFDQPSLLLSPTSLTFPSTMLGQSSAAQIVTFSASGNGALAFSNIAITGTNAGDYGLSSTTCGRTLAANASCQVQVTFTPTGAGKRSATLEFSDDVTGSPQSAPLNGTGQQPSTTTALTSASPNPSVFGQSVTFTATVSSAAPGTPTGTVNFYDGATSLGSSPLSGSQATFSTSTLSVGQHTITASYSGDASFSASMSGAFNQSIVLSLPVAVIAVNETINVNDSESFPDVFDGEAVKVTDMVTVTPLINVTAPVVEFSAGSLGFGNVAAGQAGMQSLTASAIGLAPLTISSAVLSQGSAFTVSQISCSNSSTSLPTTLPVGGACTFMISYLAPSGSAVSDSLTFTDNAGLSNVASVQSGSNYLQTIPLNGVGSGALPPPPPPAVIPVTVRETIGVADTPSFPDVFDPESIKATDLVVVQAYPLTTTSVSAPGITYGTPAVVTVSVSTVSGAVTGSVTLSVDGGAAIAQPLTNGTATFNLGVLSAGSHSLLASFAAQGTFSGSSTSSNLTVSQAKPAITWANPAAITVGTALNATQLNATASVPGTFAYTPAAETVLNAGSNQTLSVTFTPTDATDYATVTATVLLTVTKASQTIALTGVPSSATFGQGPFGISASATSGLPVSLFATGNCTLSAALSLGLSAVGNCTVTATQIGNSNYNAASALAPSFTISQDPATAVVSVSPPKVKYSDYASFSATVTPTSAGGQALTGNVQFSLDGTAAGSAVPINSSGAATLSQVQVNLPAGNHNVKAVFSSTNPNFAGTNGSTTQAVTQENAFVLYTGDTIAQVGTLLALRATVWDSAAAGYPGINPETGPTATIGDITKVWIAFDIYPAGSCGNGTPTTMYAQAVLTSTAGVGTATTMLSSTSEVSYCVISRLVAGNTGGINLFYTAPYAQAVGVDFYVNSGQFATGGGWVFDPNGSHGNFSFNARYNSNGSPKGQKVYTYRGIYNGVLADFIFKSNALTGLQFSGTTYPISATLQGKANVQINRASDGYVLFSAGNYTFSATVTDSGQNGTSGKQFSLIIYDPSGVPYHSVPVGTPLQGGNVVVHSH